MLHSQQPDHTTHDPSHWEAQVQRTRTLPASTATEKSTTRVIVGMQEGTKRDRVHDRGEAKMTVRRSKQPTPRPNQSPQKMTMHLLCQI